MPGKDGQFIQTFSGRRVWPLSPAVEEICTEDIAHALSLQCRFTGHLKDFFSVAQHSVHVSFICDPADAFWGLMHDASEAYLIDLARPVKHHPEMAFFRIAEERLHAVIAERFGLKLPIPFSVHVADDVMLWTERRDLLPHVVSWASSKCVTLQTPLAEMIEPWPWERAEREFLKRFMEVGKW